MFGTYDGCTGIEPLSLECIFSCFVNTVIGIGVNLLDSLINLGTLLGVSLPTLPF